MTWRNASEFTDELQSANVFQDNISAITIIQDRVYNGKTKHMDTRLKRTRELVKDGTLLLRYLSTHLQLADLFTKALSAVTFLRLITPILSGGIVDTSDEEE